MYLLYSVNVYTVYIQRCDQNKVLCYSIKQYINVVRILHLEAGLINPFHNCWQVTMLLKGLRGL